jgi:hypothetical protein
VVSVTSGVGIYLGSGGSVTNEAGASISATRGAISVQGGVLTLTNNGSIQTTGAYAAISTDTGAIITNGTAGHITSARTGISLSNTIGTIDNKGTIVSTATSSATAGVAIYLGNGGLITNEAGALIKAYRSAIPIAKYGTATNNTTIVNHGTIVGKEGIYIGASGGTGANTIVDYGVIQGTNGIAISLGAVGDRVVVGSATATIIGALGNFKPGDTIDLPFLTYDPAGTATVTTSGTVTNVLKVVESSGTFIINLDPSENFAGYTFKLSNDGSGKTLVSEQPACFCRGTLIGTERGELPIEDLAVGDRVVTLSGEPSRSSGSADAPMTVGSLPAIATCCRSASKPARWPTACRRATCSCRPSMRWSSMACSSPLAFSSTARRSGRSRQSTASNTSISSSMIMR